MAGDFYMTEQELKQFEHIVIGVLDDEDAILLARAVAAEVRRLRGRRLYNRRKLRPRLIALCQAMHDMWPPKKAKVGVNKNGRPEIRWTVDKGDYESDEWAEFAPWHFEMSDEAFAAYVRLLTKQRDYENPHLREYASPPPYRTHINAGVEPASPKP
jgi:hypothetical protein